MTSVVTRAATLSDAAFLIEHDHVLPEIIMEQLVAGRILVADDSGVVIAWLRWNLFWDEIPFMNMLFVLEPHRNLGLGTALMEAWETDVGHDGHQSVMTSSQADEKAQYLYRKRGYVDCGVLVLPNQAAELMFRKELSDAASPIA